MTIEELHAQTNAKIMEIIERIEAMVSKRDGLAEAVKSLADRLDAVHERLAKEAEANHAVLVGRLDVMDQVNASFNSRIEELSDKLNTMTERMEENRVTREAWSNDTDAAIDILQAEKKVADEMRGDVKLCKSAIRDLDSIRDSATRAANQVAGFEPRLSQMEESFAAFQTLRHDADSPRPDEALARSDGG